jgi:hypothetical protein
VTPKSPESATEKRYEISVLIGPCSSEEAEDFMMEIGDEFEDKLGASYSVGEYKEEADG